MTTKRILELEVCLNDDQVQGVEVVKMDKCLHDNQVQGIEVDEQVQSVEVGEQVQVFMTIRTMTFLPPVLLLPNLLPNLLPTLLPTPAPEEMLQGRPILGVSTIFLLISL